MKSQYRNTEYLIKESFTTGAGFGFGTPTSSFGTAGQTGGGLFGSTAKPAGFGGFGTTATQPAANTGLGTGEFSPRRYLLRVLNSHSLYVDDVLIP